MYRKELISRAWYAYLVTLEDELKQAVFALDTHEATDYSSRVEHQKLTAKVQVIRDQLFRDSGKIQYLSAGADGYFTKLT